MGSGTCGSSDNANGVTWVVSDAGKLTITGGTNTRMGDVAGSGWPFTSGTLKDDVLSVEIQNITYIGTCAFASLPNVTSITIPTSVTSMGNAVFSGCTNLTTVTFASTPLLPASVPSLGINMFGNCTSLSSITIPASVTTIGKEAFNGCTVLTAVTFLGLTPPTFATENNSFTGVAATGTIMVPAGTASVYKDALIDKGMPSVGLSGEVGVAWTIFLNKPALSGGTMTAGTVGVSYTYSLGGTNTPTSYTHTGGTLPDGLIVNNATGAITGIPTEAGTFSNLKFTATNGDGTSPEAIYSLTISLPAKPVIATSPGALTGGKVGANYTATIAASNTPTAFSVTASTVLPPGLSIATTGVISGQPTTVGTYNFSIVATNAGGDSDPVAFYITVGPPEPTITTTAGALASGTIETPYTASVTASYDPTAFAVSSGALPDGLELGNDGVISGTPTADGTFNFGLKATNSVGTSAEVLFSIEISERTTYPEVPSTTDTITTTEPTAPTTTAPIVTPTPTPVPTQTPTTTPTPEPTGEVLVELESEVEGSVDEDGRLDVTLNEQQADKLIEQAQQVAHNQGANAGQIEIVLNVHEVEGSSSAQFYLSEAVLHKFAEAGVTSITVVTDDFQYTFEPGTIPISGGGATIVAIPSEAPAAAEGSVGDRPVWYVTLEHATSKAMKSAITGSTLRFRAKYTPTEAETRGKLCIVKINADGSVDAVKSSYYADGWMIWTGKVDNLYGISYIPHETRYKDIDDHWTHYGMDYAITRGYVDGLTTSKYGPDKLMTRAEISAAMAKLLNIEEIPIAKPHTSLSRKAMADYIVECFKAAGEPLPQERAAIAFSDVSNANVTAVQRAGIMSYRDGDQFQPNASVLRGEFAEILLRASKLMTNPKSAMGWSNSDSGSKQYYNKNGTMLTGWQIIDKATYYFDSYGNMATGFQTIGSDTYYFGATGARVANRWREIDGDWYYFYEDGKMARSTVVDGYSIGADGKRQ